MNEEIIDIYDDEMHHVGTASKAEAHRLGLWHKNFHVWIAREHDGRKKVLLQKRSLQKKTFAGKFDVSVAGHYSAGEKTEDGIREIHEELGLLVAFSDLIEIGNHRDVFETEGYTNREFCNVYLLIDTTPLEQYQLQVEEVDGLCEIDLIEFSEFLGKKQAAVSMKYFDNTTKKVSSCLLHQADLMPDNEKYYQRVLDFIQSAF